MKVRHLVTVAGAGFAVFLGAAGGWWALSPEEPVRVSRAAPRHAAARPMDVEPHAPAPHRPRPALRAAPEPTGPLRDLAPDERRELRTLARDLQWTDTDARLHAYAEEAGWDAETTEQVRAILAETTDEVSRRLRRADEGKVSWEELRPRLREFRLDQVDRLRETLGDEEFRDFAVGMDFWRFNGGAPPGRPMNRFLPEEEE
jgi:hypothetical protein